VNLFDFLRRKKWNVQVRPATVEDLITCVGMGYDACKEEALPVQGLETYFWITDMMARLVETPRAELFVALDDAGEITGMICCTMALPDVWDGAEVDTAWGLYVEPSHRRNAGTALSLIEAVANAGKEWSATKIRVTIDDEALKQVNRYRNQFGFTHERSYQTYYIEMAE
jgi:hypothetical protein